MITITESAAKQIRQVQTEENTDSPLRVFVQGGGCSGFTYAFTFEDDGTAADDFVIDAPDGVQVLVDAMSMNLLSGAEIDFKRDLTAVNLLYAILMLRLPVDAEVVFQYKGLLWPTQIKY